MALICLSALFAAGVAALAALDGRRARRPSLRARREAEALIDEAAGHAVGVTMRLDR